MNYITRWYKDKEFVEELKKTNTQVMSMEHQEKIVLISLLIGIVASGVLQTIYGPFWFWFDVFDSMTFGYIMNTMIQVMGLMGVAYAGLMVIALIKKYKFLHFIKKLERNLEAISPLKRWTPDPRYCQKADYSAVRDITLSSKELTAQANNMYKRF